MKSEKRAEDLLWENTGIRMKVVDELRMFAGEYGISRIILFGSRARGDYRRDSDIDLAVSGDKVDLFRLAVEEETSTLLKYDVLDLDVCPDAGVLEEIRRDGKILYEKV